MWGLTPKECSRNLIALLLHLTKSMGANAAGDILVSPHSITVISNRPFARLIIVDNHDRTDEK
jgi:hypothetical protein